MRRELGSFSETEACGIATAYDELARVYREHGEHGEHKEHESAQQAND